MHKFDKFSNPTLPDIAATELDFYAKVFRETCSSDGLMGGAITVEILGQSDLSRGQLARVWDLVDVDKRGALNQAEFIVAMHLVRSVKAGCVRNVPTLVPSRVWDQALDVPPPTPEQLQEIVAESPNFSTETPPDEILHHSPLPASPPAPAVPPAAVVPPVPPVPPLPPLPPSPPKKSKARNKEWKLSPEDVQRANLFFDMLDIENVGLLDGPTAAHFLTTSKIAKPDLEKIWNKADFNKDGRLDRAEFAVAVLLVRKKIKENEVPSEVRVLANKFFDTLDLWGHGYVDVETCKSFFVKSQLPGDELEEIWGQANLDGDGRLSRKEFATALHLLREKVKLNLPDTPVGQAL